MPKSNDIDNRPNPDAILANMEDDTPNQKGKLKIFFGYAAGVGKTYAMLDEAREQLKNGVDVVVGYVEPHMRPETMHLLEGLPFIPPKIIEYKNIELKEFDLDAALDRKPSLILVDELAHTNAIGVRNKKRYQDVEELLNAGIDVYTTVNVQHIESLNNVVSDITKITVQETVPDYIFDRADKIKIIDIEPDELLKRLEEGKIYTQERAQTAVQNFFTKENLRTLREIAIRKAADRIRHESETSRRTSKSGTANSKLMVCISTSPSSVKCVRWAARIAEAFFIPWAAVYVETRDPDSLSEQEKKRKTNNIELAEKLGAEIVTISGEDVTNAISEYAKLAGVTDIVIGKSRRKGLFHKDFAEELMTLLPSVDIHITPDNETAHAKNGKRAWKHSLSLSWLDFAKTFILLTLATLISYGLRALNIGDQNVIMMYILSVLIISRVTKGYLYGIIAAIISPLALNFFFVVPYYSFNAIQPGYPITFLIMLISAIITSTLTVQTKKQAKIAVRHVQRTSVLYEINKRLLATRGLDNIVNLINGFVTKLFNRSVIFYTNLDDHHGHLMQIKGEHSEFLKKEDEHAVAHWVFVNQKMAGAGTDTLMGAGALYIPVISQGKSVGVIGISCEKGLVDQDTRFFLQMITSQVAMALERQALSDEQQRIVVEYEKERTRNQLLREFSDSNDE